MSRPVFDSFAVFPSNRSAYQAVRAWVRRRCSRELAAFAAGLSTSGAAIPRWWEGCASFAEVLGAQYRWELGRSVC